MPHNALQLQGGVVVNETPAVNSAGISACNLIRFKPDPKGLSLPEKLGGWAKFYGAQIVNGVVRAINGYQDTNTSKWIVYGTGNPAGAQLAAVECFTVGGTTTASTTGNFFFDITPQIQSDSVDALFATTSGNPLVQVTDPTVSGVTQYDTAYITTPVAVGGLVLNGMYSLTTLSGDQYELTATNVLAQPVVAGYSTVSAPITVTSGSFTPGVVTGTITLGWATPSYTFPVGEAVVVNGASPVGYNGTFIATASTTTSVTLAAYTNSLGAYTSGGSLTNYGVVPLFQTTQGSPIVTCIFPNHGYQVGSTFFVLNETLVNGITLFGAYTVASVLSTSSFTFNGPLAAQQTGLQFQNAVSVNGGSCDGSHVTLNLAVPTYVSPSIVPTAGTGDGVHVTLSWSSPSYSFVIGDTILVSGMTPNAWNGTQVVTGATSTSVTYANATSGTGAVFGAIVNAPFNIGAYINVSGASPTGWNGYYAVTGVTATSVSYANSTGATTWVNGGSVADNGGDVAFIYSIGLGPSQAGTGFGVGGFGVGGFGTGAVTTPVTGTNIPATTWDISNWGNVTIATAYGVTPIIYPDHALPFQPVYYWDPTQQQQIAQAIPQGPPAVTGSFIAMPQRQIIVWGVGYNGIVDPLQVGWSDINNFNTWVPLVTNQAGSYRIPSGAEIRGGMQTPQQGLVWTDVELWSMVYISQPYVWSFNKIGSGCGLIAKKAKAMGSLNGVVYWMGATQFFNLTGEGVQAIPCPVWDVVFQQLDMANAWKIVCAPNSLFQEVTWYYPVIGGTGENSAYVRYNALLGVWDYGSLDRSAWTDVSALGPPIGASPSAGYLYQHEISPDADGAAMDSWFETGWFALSEGDFKVFVDQWWPDFKYTDYNAIAQTPANIQMTFTVAGYPDSTSQTYGPYTVTQGTTYISPRMRPRLMKIKCESSDLGSFWRLGQIRYRWQPDGRF